MRVLLDTNVLIAAFVSHGACHDLLEYCFQHHEIVSSDHLLTEFERTLERKLRFARSEAREAARLLRWMAMLVEPRPLEAPVCRDPDNDHVLAAALHGEVACIVTGDRDLLSLEQYRGIRVLPPERFWQFE